MLFESLIYLPLARGLAGASLQLSDTSGLIS